MELSFFDRIVALNQPTQQTTAQLDPTHRLLQRHQHGILSPPALLNNEVCADDTGSLVTNLPVPHRAHRIDTVAIALPCGGR